MNDPADEQNLRVLRKNGKLAGEKAGEQVLKLLRASPGTVFSFWAIRHAIPHITEDAIESALRQYRDRYGIRRLGWDQYAYDEATAGHFPRRGRPLIVHAGRSYRTRERTTGSGSVITVTPIDYDIGRGRWRCVIERGGLAGGVVFRSAGQLTPPRSARV